jgi:hypothetical protein
MLRLCVFMREHVCFSYYNLPFLNYFYDRSVSTPWLLQERALRIDQRGVRKAVHRSNRVAIVIECNDQLLNLRILPLIMQRNQKVRGLNFQRLISTGSLDSTVSL